MRLKSFIALAVVTVAVAAGAVYTLTERESATRGSTESRPLYPGLTGRINDVDRLTIRTSADGTITLARDGDRWGMAERYAYPVDFEKVRNALIEVAAINTLEPRTSKPELYDKLQVEDVEKELSNSIRVTAAAGDETVADLIVGKTRPIEEGGGVFVRKAGDERSWLAEGSFQPQRKFVQWLDRNIVNVDQRRIRLVEMTRPDGQGVLVSKDDPSGEAYTLETPVPEGRKVKAESELRALASITDFLILEDVRPASEVDFTTETIVDRFVTFDGMELVMEVVEQEDETWVRLSAGEAERAEELDTFVEENKGKDSREGRIADQMKTPEEIGKEIASINERIEGWAYRVTDYKTGKLRTTIDDITEELETAASGDTAPAPTQAPATAPAGSR